VGHLQQQPLLRINALGFGRKVAKELAVKLVNLVDKASLGVANAPRLFWARIVKQGVLPAIDRHIAYGVDAGKQSIPAGRWRIDTARKAAADTDDGKRFALRMDWQTICDGYVML
jgi:hypothetical protein